jgi:hypothetical protein
MWVLTKRRGNDLEDETVVGGKREDPRRWWGGVLKNREVWLWVSFIIVNRKFHCDWRLVQGHDSFVQRLLQQL